MAAGDAAYFGFEYQIYASVFLMINEHRNMSFSELVIETAFGDDAEVQSHQTSRTPEDTGKEQSFNTILSNGILNKRIQIKTKARQYMWLPSDLRDILLKQDESHVGQHEIETVLDRLSNNQNEIFVFFTDGVVHPKLAGLRVEPQSLQRRQPDADTDAIIAAIVNSTTQRGIKSKLRRLTKEVIGRALIIDSLDFEVLKKYIRESIFYTYGIPYDQCSDKLLALVDIVRKRILREDGQNSITLNQLEQIIGSPSPKSPYSELEKGFVETEEYHKTIEILEQRHVVVICGEPCIGKTTVARAIVNRYFEKNYEFCLLTGNDAHLQVANSCLHKETRIFLIDNGFGSLNYEKQIPLADQLPSLISQLSNANGRVKLIITTRRNILAEAITASRLRGYNLTPYQVNIPSPSNKHIGEVFSKLLTGLAIEDTQSIVILTTISKFENLLHLKHFVDNLQHETNVDIARINELIETSRPSEYIRWIRSQSVANQLCLFVLWMLTKACNSVKEEELERIYVLAENCANLPSLPSLTNRFQECLDDLVKQQNRIERGPHGILNFIHPHLYHAVADYLSNGKKFPFLENLASELAKVDHPLEQSVASTLFLAFRSQFKIDIKQEMEKLLTSRFVQTIETIIRIGGTSLFYDESNIDTEESIESKNAFLEREYLISREQCHIDENGHLVRKVNNPERYLDSWEERSERLSVELGLKTGHVSEQTHKFYEALLIQGNLSTLNPLERYEFLLWLFNNHEAVQTTALSYAVRNAANDPISFVRGAVHLFFDHQSLEKLEDLYQCFRDLCYDGHPYVKLEMLEQVILRNWRLMSEEIQTEWLQIVSDMLDDPTVRLHSSMGLIDQSGSFAYYHSEHTREQKQQWFIALAPKLIQHGFTHQVYFDRFLTPIDRDFVNLPRPFRTELLDSIAEYIEKKPFTSEDTLYSIEKVILEGAPTKEENDICLRLLSKLSSWSKSRVGYTLAKEYSSLPDTRFRQFVHRPFYNESESQFVAERAAVFLGFKANPSISLNELPHEISQYNSISANEALDEYCRQQMDEFKLLAVMMAYGYGEAHHIGANSDRCFEFEVINGLIVHFSEHNDIRIAKIIIEIILNKVHLWSSESLKVSIEYMPFDQLVQSKWFKNLELFLYNSNSQIGKFVCEAVFASNIASSVHNVRTFLFLTHLFLNHPDESVSQHAFVFFDKYFYEIKEFLFDADLPTSWQTEIEQLWFNSDFQAKLFQRSNAYRVWRQYSVTFSNLTRIWTELPEETRSKIFLQLERLDYKDRPEVVELLHGLYSTICRLTSEEENKQLENIIAVKQAILEERYEKVCNELDPLMANVDWPYYKGLL